MTPSSLVERAAAILDGNWSGRATKPAPRLYPHQWSWDSAFIAIGNRHRRWDRAVTEITTLFDAQWGNGMVPHIVFTGDDPGYFPAGSFWESSRSPHCPPGVDSSGICQPPIHATAVIGCAHKALVVIDGIRLAGQSPQRSEVCHHAAAE